MVIFDLDVFHLYKIMLIWKAKKTSGKILFLLTRYPIVFGSIVWLICKCST